MVTRSASEVGGGFPRLRCAFFCAVAVIAAPGGTIAKPLELDDAPVRVAADKVRDEAQQDRIDALAHFATGRTLQQRGEYLRACRHFARADRLDPASCAARSALVAAAIEGKHYALAARYAVKRIDPRAVGEEALEVLANLWMNEENLPKAIECSQQALLCIAARKKAAAERADAESMANAQIAELNLRYAFREVLCRAGKYAEAAEQAACVVEVLDHPDRLRIPAVAAAKLLEVELPVAYRSLGDTFLLAGRFDEAEAAFRRSHGLSPDETLLDLNLARIAARRGKAQEALAKLQPYFARHLTSEGTIPCEVLADVLKKLGKEKELLDRLQKLHEADPMNVPLSYFLAGEYLKAGKLLAAEPIYEALAAHSPAMLTYPALAEIHRRSRRPERLLALLGKVVTATGTLDTLGTEAKPLTSDAKLFQDLVKVGRKKAHGPLARADYAEFLVLGTLAQDRKQYDTANEFFELAIQADVVKLSEVLLAWGIGSLLAERTQEAIEVFQRGIDAKAMPGGNPLFHFYLAGALAAKEKPDAAALDAALASARLAAKLTPDSARFAVRPPWILVRARRFDEARQGYEKVLEKFGGESNSLETSLALRGARLELSNVCVILGRSDEAEQRLEEVLDEHPDDAEANNDLGFLWADENRHLQRALRMTLAAVAAESDNRAYRDSLGWVYYRLGRYGEAVAELEKALDEKRPDGTVLDHLGDAYAKFGKSEKAQAAWRRAKEAFEKDKEPEKAKQVAQKTKASNR
jgi:tetratricopeptide (TPR) repeat protein